MELKWDNKYSVGNEYIDNQHKVILSLIAIIQHYPNHIGGNVDSGIVGKTIERLIDYTVNHFADEEEILSRHNYGGLVQHQMIHKNLIEQTKKLQEKYTQIGEEVLPILSDFLNNWLLTHILGIDMKYKPFVGRTERPLDSKAPKIGVDDIQAYVGAQNQVGPLVDTDSNDRAEKKAGKEVCREVGKVGNVKCEFDYLNNGSVKRTFFVYEDTTIDRVIEIMKERNITNVLVLNPKDEITAIATESDIVRRYASVYVEDRKSCRINAIASRPVNFVRVEHIEEDVKAILIQKDIRHFPLIKGGGVSKKNIVGFMDIADVAAMGLAGAKKDGSSKKMRRTP